MSNEFSLSHLAQLVEESNRRKLNLHSFEPNPDLQFKVMVRFFGQRFYELYSTSETREGADEIAIKAKRMYGNTIADIRIDEPSSITSAFFETKVYTDHAGDQPIVLPYKSGTLRDGVLRAKERGEDVGIYDERHPWHHLIADSFYDPVTGDAAAYYCPYIPEPFKKAIAAEEERARKERVICTVAHAFEDMFFGTTDDARFFVEGMSRLGFDIVERPAPAPEPITSENHPWHHLVVDRT